MRNKVLLAVFAALFLLLCWSVSGYSQQAQQTTNREEIVLTTYYPTPFGDYREMRAERMAVGPNWRSYVNVCWEQGKCTETADGSADLIVEGNVGIGNTYKPQKPVPNAEQGNLDVNDVYLRSVENWASQTRIDFSQINIPGEYDSMVEAWTSWQDVPSASVNLTKGKYLVIFTTSAYNGDWLSPRGEFKNVRLSWSHGASRAQALAGTERAQQVGSETVLIEVITLQDDDTIRAQWLNGWGGGPVVQFYHSQFVIAKLP